jgi:hypothetical protein
LVFDSPATDRVYIDYLETCRRIGVDPVPWDCAQDLMAEWSDAIAARPSVRRRGFGAAHRNCGGIPDHILLGRDRGLGRRVVQTSAAIQFR